VFGAVCCACAGSMMMQSCCSTQASPSSVVSSASAVLLRCGAHAVLNQQHDPAARKALPAAASCAVCPAVTPARWLAVRQQQLHAATWLWCAACGLLPRGVFCATAAATCDLSFACGSSSISTGAATCTALQCGTPAGQASCSSKHLAF
jgi:hypothetical protein